MRAVRRAGQANPRRWRGSDLSSAAKEAVARVAIREDLDVFEARWAARRVATGIGFPTRDTEEVVLAVSELATNILKFAPPGVIAIQRIDDPDHGAGLRVTAADSGPPLVDFERVLEGSKRVGVAMEWTGRGLGGGLGAVYRFTDALRCVPAAGGKQMIAERYLRRPRR